MSEWFYPPDDSGEGADKYFENSPYLSDGLESSGEFFEFEDDVSLIDSMSREDPDEHMPFGDVSEDARRMMNAFITDLKHFYTSQPEGGLVRMRLELERFDPGHHQLYLPKSRQHQHPLHALRSWIKSGMGTTVAEFLDSMYGSNSEKRKIVDYFDEVARTSPEELRKAGIKYVLERRREKYLVTIEGGKLHRRNRLSKGGEDKSLGEPEPIAHAPNEHGIFVQGPSGAIYSHRLKLSRFHHSSFLGGGDVKAAGEWECDKGTLKVLRAQSGHYKPDPATLKEFIFDIGKRGADLSQAVVRCWRDGKGRDVRETRADVWAVNYSPDDPYVPYQHTRMDE